MRTTKITKAVRLSNKLTARDFTYVYEVGIGQTYQNGPYLILAGSNSYAATYKGQTFSCGLEFFNEAVEACASFEARRIQEGARQNTKEEQPSSMEETTEQARQRHIDESLEKAGFKRGALQGASNYVGTKPAGNIRSTGPRYR
jgi:hypothetical protein